MTVGELIDFLSSYSRDQSVHLWVNTAFYKGQTNKWRQCPIGEITISPEGMIICQGWKEEYDG